MGAIIATPIAIVASLLSTRLSDIKCWSKWIVSYFYIELFRCLEKKRFDLYDVEVDHDPYKVGFLPHPIEKTYESPLPDSQLQHRADEIFFYGVNSKSECIIVRIARGSNEEAEVWIYLKLSNGKVYQKHETGFQQSSCDERTFTCGGLQMNYLIPMRKWRIFFSGLLRETNDDDETSGKMTHAKFAVIWYSSSDAYDFTADVNSKALATSLAKAKWNHYLPPIEELNSAMNLYAQGGFIMGTVSIDGSEEECVHFFGERLRYIGDTTSLAGTEFCHVLGQITKTGRFVHIVEVSIANVVENLRFGFSIASTGKIENISGANGVLLNLTDRNKDEDHIEAKFHADGDPYVLKGALFGKQTVFQNKIGWDGRATIDCLEYELNSYKGKGIVLSGKIMKPSKRNPPKSLPYPSPSVVPLVVQFSEKICQNPEVTGGKGSSLGKLTELSKDFQNFVVPNGVVVTTGAYELFITKEILKEITKLENLLYNDKIDEAKLACERVMNEVIKSPMPDQILQAVKENLEKAIPDKKHDHKVAVRSSATGEDTEQMSAAGQMETYLGVVGINEISTSIKKCWASQFSYMAVQYKRQNGQIINSPMAVVVQQMISCDVAGVLFTCDPLTGNPLKMSITANYGLGESVVSGSEEPDTLEIERISEDNLVIKNKMIGSKQRRIVLKDDGGTNVEEISENEKETCCITDAMALRLAHLAVKIEKSYRSYRDIEWGFWNNNLYLFQSRPVTSGSGETDVEIDHEFDGPMRNEKDYFTMCNVGEVMPGATSPLGAQLFLKFFYRVFQTIHFVDGIKLERFQYYPRMIVPMSNHIMFYAVDLFQRISESFASAQATSVGFFGRLIEDEELFEMARERYSKRISKNTIVEQIELLTRALFTARRKLKHDMKAYSGYHVPVEKCKNSLEIFDQLMYCCTDICEAFGSHLACTGSSSFLNSAILGIFLKTKKEVDAEVYTDFAQLINTSSDLESADVPAAIENLACYINKDISAEEFKRMTPEEAVRWLETTSSPSGRKYKEFLQKHGHRCLKEFDVFSRTWEMDPKSLIPLLQNLAGIVKREKPPTKSESSGNLLSKLKTPLSFKSKLLLRVLIPLSRRQVENRENSKSLLIRTLNEWRKGYRKLAKMMVLEGRIPEEDLLFFMSPEEIDELLRTRSPKIISKASRRRKRHPMLDKYIYPEIMQGFPKAINKKKTDISVYNSEYFSMKGIPVSQGTATGIVRVALTLEEAALLQPGEILLTYSTDIGWSPYFPILGGVVTELGGLISHGAVVSREYGLPCIAGLHGATHQFQTGDYVLLDGNKGILQKIPKPQDS